MPRTSKSPTLRIAAAACALGASLVLSGCGFDAQTLMPYTPAQGINADVANGPKVRNLLVIANTSGAGRLSASLLAAGKADALTAVAVTSTQADGQPGAALTVSKTQIDLPANKLVVLTDGGVTPITVTGSSLKPGLTATVKLTFSSGAITELVVPVMDAASPIYSGISLT